MLHHKGHKDHKGRNRMALTFLAFLRVLRALCGERRCCFACTEVNGETERGDVGSRGQTQVEGGRPMRSAYWSIAAAVALTCLLLVSGARAAGAGDTLPQAVKDAIVKAFPNATVSSVDQERESGVRYYELNPGGAATSPAPTRACVAAWAWRSCSVSSPHLAASAAPACVTAACSKCASACPHRIRPEGDLKYASLFLCSI